MKKAWAWFKTNWNVVLDSILWGGALNGIFLLGWAALIYLAKKDYCGDEWFALGCLMAATLAFSYETYKFIKKPKASLVLYAKNIIYKSRDDQSMDIEFHNGSTDEKAIQDDKKN